MNILSLLVSTLQPLSFVLGLFAGLAGIGTLLLITHGRLVRLRLMHSMHMEQAGKNNLRLENDAHRLRVERDELNNQLQLIRTDNGALQSIVSETEKQTRSQQQIIEQVRSQLVQQFQIMADQILAEKGQSLSRQHEKGLQALLLPLREQINAFRGKVEDVHERESRDRVSIIKEIEHLRELNEQISADALNLTNALRGKNKVQGQWGEMLLERLLEQSGLRRGSEFEVQAALQTERHQLRQPDVIVHLPRNRDIIIDAKVSLKAYLQAHQEEDPTKQEQYLQQHIESLKKHISGLSRKKYPQLLEAGNLDFVLLFLPIENAFQIAVSRQPDLISVALRQNVILTSPSTILAILRTIHHMWRLDEQNRNGLAIAKQAGNLYDKFIGFVEAFEEIGTRLDQSKQAWRTGRNRLTEGQGNLVNRAEALKQLGVQGSKSLPASMAALAGKVNNQDSTNIQQPHSPLPGETS